MNIAKDSPQHVSIEAFIDECDVDGVFEFTLGDAQLIAKATSSSIKQITKELVELGFTLVLHEERRREVRGITSNPHGNRWTECPSHGGSGWEQISGWAGQDQTSKEYRHK